MRETPTGGYYRHFKDSWYKIVCIAKHTEGDDHLVIYKALKDGKVYARDLKMFMGEVPKEKENPTGQKYRFMSVQELGLEYADMHRN